MIKEVIDRRGAIGGMMGCLMSPFIPALRVPKKLEPSRVFLVVHYDGDYGYSAGLADTSIIRIKYYKNDSVASHIIRQVYEEGEHPGFDALLRSIWDKHDHELYRVL